MPIKKFCKLILEDDKKIIEMGVPNDTHQKYLERKQKQEARKAQSEKAKKEKLARTLNNQNQKE